jgi:hypothetical protein
MNEDTIENTTYNDAKVAGMINQPALPSFILNNIACDNINKLMR